MIVHVDVDNPLSCETSIVAGGDMVESESKRKASAEAEDRLLSKKMKVEEEEDEEDEEEEEEDEDEVENGEEEDEEDEVGEEGDEEGEEEGEGDEEGEEEDGEDDGEEDGDDEEEDEEDEGNVKPSGQNDGDEEEDDDEEDEDEEGEEEGQGEDDEEEDEEVEDEEEEEVEPLAQAQDDEDGNEDDEDVEEGEGDEEDVDQVEEDDEEQPRQRVTKKYIRKYTKKYSKRNTATMTEEEGDEDEADEEDENEDDNENDNETANEDKNNYIKKEDAGKHNKNHHKKIKIKSEQDNYEADSKDDQDDQEVNQTDVVDDKTEDQSTQQAEADGEATEDNSNITTFVFDDVEYKYKERPAVVEEREGKIEFRVVNNDNKPESMMILTGLKNIFQKQLPKMPREYIARLVYDRSHVSIAVVRRPNLQVVGGITYRPFESRKFAEIVFCAISSTEQVRGYGAHLMNHLKDYVKGTTPIMYFLTYADNYAIGYFKKQGFTKEISLEKSVWMGYIKDYEGGTIMQCSMLPKIRYLDAGKILLLQKAAIMAKIREISKSHIVRPGVQAFRNGVTKIDPMTIPGLKEAGWTPEMDELARRPKRGPHFAVMQHLLSEMENHPSAWPFAQPVNRDEVPDYYEVIKEPMDLSSMESRLEADSYASMEDFIYDARLIFNNCRSYNNESTTYYKNATKLEKFLYAKVREIPEYSHLVE